MGATFEKATEDEVDFLQEVMVEFEPDLAAKRVTVAFLFARGETTDAGHYKPPLVKKGVRAIADVKINSYADRVEGKSDATIRYDVEQWDQHSDAVRRAVLHHELHHLMLQMGEYGVKTDDAGRPMLKMRPHDFEVGWFKDIAAIHGHNAVETHQAGLLLDDAGQMLWPWAPDAPKPLDAFDKSIRSRASRAAAASASAN